ncbi:hypothetical protein HQ545_00470 [Candidatus Woesearchaeota archaeon]|nr:hypothetical protein [Candidatus Woesearchaeota archaeon]
MVFTQIIPKRYETFCRCIDALLNNRDGLFQSELKRLVYEKSWRNNVKKEIELWNHLISQHYPGYAFVEATPMRNPNTCKTNEVLYKIPEELIVQNAPDHYYLKSTEVKKQ